MVAAFDMDNAIAGDGEAGVYAEDDKGVRVGLSCRRRRLDQARARSKGQAAASTRYWAAAYSMRTESGKSALE